MQNVSQSNSSTRQQRDTLFDCSTNVPSECNKHLTDMVFCSGDFMPSLVLSGDIVVVHMAGSG